MFIDRSTRASIPARIPVRWATYIRTYPAWAVIVGVGWSLCVWRASILEVPSLWAVCALGFALIGWRRLERVQSIYSDGMLCPAVVLEERPCLIGVLTDLSASPYASRPVLKVFSPDGRLPTLTAGTRLAAAAYYAGLTPSGHWDDCHPHLALAANDSPELQERLLARFREADWRALAEACLEVRAPYRCGLYSVQRGQRAEV